MKLRYYESEVLDRLRSDISSNLGYYHPGADNRWVSKYDFRESQFEIDFQEEQAGFLKISPEYEDDCENAIELFKRLNRLTAKQASSECFWSCMCHTIPEFYNYACVRWLTKNGAKENGVRERFFGISPKKMAMKNALARLWWSVFVSYDCQASDKYALTRVLWKYQTRFQDFMDTFNSYSRVRSLGVLDALKIRDENEGLYLVVNDGQNKSDFRSLNKYLNHYSVIAPLDFLEREQVRDLALDFFRKRRERLSG